LCEEKASETEEERKLLEKAAEIAAKMPQAATARPEELVQRLSAPEFARQVLGPEIMKRPDWPLIWCRLLCWIRYIVCVWRCPPFLRDVWIKSVGRVDSADPLNRMSKLVADPARGEETPVGGVITISGCANISGAGRKVKRYSLWYAPYDKTHNKWVDAPPDHTALPSGWVGPITSIEYAPPHTHTWSCGPYSGSNTVTNGDLTNRWEKSSCAYPPPAEYWHLRRTRWDTRPIGSGRFTVLLMVEDDLGGIYYDSQRVWIDNKEIVGRIEGIKGVKPCESVRMSLKTVSIMGEAYDPPIDPTITPVTPPNDNFDYYNLKFRKQGAPSYQIISPPGNVTAPVGPGVGVLVQWDLTMLDKATNPMGLPSNQLLERGETCPYTIQLYVRDKTHVSDTATPHYIYDHWPVNIVNDLG